MTAAKLLALGVNLSMALMVFGLALGAGRTRLRSILGSPGLLARSLVAMFVVMPLVAILVARNLGLNRAVLVALLLIALSPVPPALPSKQLKSGGGEAYVLGLFVVSAVVAIVVVPAGVSLIGWLFGRVLEVPFGVAAQVVVISVLLPVVLGLLSARAAPAFAGKAAGVLPKVSGILLIVSLAPMLWAAWGPITAQMTNFTVAAIAGFIAVGLLAGHLLGGPRGEDRTALALATATRHPGVAMAVLNALGSDPGDVVPVVILYLLIGSVATIPYLRVRRAAAGAAGN